MLERRGAGVSSSRKASKASFGSAGTDVPGCGTGAPGEEAIFGKRRSNLTGEASGNEDGDNKGEGEEGGRERDAGEGETG